RRHGYLLHNQGIKQWFQTEDVSTVIGALNQHIDSTVKTYTGVRSIGIHAFMDAKVQPRKKLLGDWLLYKSLSIIYAERGLGKTQLALEIAMAVATGTDCLGWKSHGAEGVLYVDGEMSGHDMKVRLSNIISSKKLTDNNINFELITPEISPWLPDLSTEEGRHLIFNIVGQKKIKLVIIDNISSLCRSNEYSENDAISWKAIQEWAVDMRSQGCSIIFIHHAGKNGKQRGTSKREDVMDIVIGLKPIKDDAANDDVGARFDILFEKTRHSFGSAVKPIKGRTTYQHRWNSNMGYIRPYN
ncbi:AAA family ATPase, partial [Mariprofundus ferrooxydans]